jgi:hypothetical protein
VIFACPAAPPDHPLKDLFFTNIALSLRRSKRSAVSRKSEAKTESVRESSVAEVKSIKLVPRLKIPAMMFKRNRKKAMKKVQSSKYGYKYNFGGYIPGIHYRKKEMEKIVNIQNYAEYLEDSYTDFLAMLILGEDSNKFNPQSHDEAESIPDKSKLAEAELKREKSQRYKRIFQPNKNYWNAEVLDYISTGIK